MKSNFVRVMQCGAICLIVLVVFGAVNMLASSPQVHALPEYTRRTGEPCATCHVSPGGGGPRTLRGMLWAARGRPDRVPTLPNMLIAPGVKNGAELYDIACAACHGVKGEGLFGASLTDTILREPKIRANILRGRTRSGMPAFQGQFTDEQIEVLVAYVAGLASGRVKPPSNTYLLPPSQPGCASQAKPQGETPRPVLAPCGGN